MVKITNHKYKHEMKLRNIGSMESSELVTVAALFIILAGMYFARTIVAPILLALFISIVCAQPITWLKEKGLPGWIGLILVALGLVTLFLGFTFLIGGTLSYFASNVSKYDSTLSEIGHSMLLFLSSKGIDLPDNQFANFIQSAKILEYTSTVLKELLRLFGNSFLIFLIILFILIFISILLLFSYHLFVLQGFGHVEDLNGFRVFQVGDGAGDLDQAKITTGGEIVFLAGQF